MAKDKKEKTGNQMGGKEMGARRRKPVRWTKKAAGRMVNQLERVTPEQLAMWKKKKWVEPATDKEVQAYLDKMAAPGRGAMTTKDTATD